MTEVQKHCRKHPHVCIFKELSLSFSPSTDCQLIKSGKNYVTVEVWFNCWLIFACDFRNICLPHSLDQDLAMTKIAA